MLYDDVKKLLTKSKLPKNFKSNFAQKAKVNIKEITQTEKDTITALNKSITEATVILIEDNRRIFKAIENIKINQFKELKFPFENFFIEFNFQNPDGNNNNSNDNMTIGLHVYPDHVIGLKSNNIYIMYSCITKRVTVAI